MWNITHKGVNKMLGNYFSYHISPEVFEHLRERLNVKSSTFEEDDQTITDTFPREIIADEIVKIVFEDESARYPTYIDGPEILGPFIEKLARELDDGTKIYRS